MHSDLLSSLPGAGPHYTTGSCMAEKIPARKNCLYEMVTFYFLGWDPRALPNPSAQVSGCVIIAPQMY